jgi:D-beta-D-heptose 7-phosphate kinase/D-beta-D-heptose 1-phosphate adenosyltransferase
MSDVISVRQARKFLKNMTAQRVLVVGDVMLDEWLWGAVHRISPEAPVPVVRVTNRSFTLGGAANVAKNLRQLTRKVAIAGGVARDTEGARVRRLLEEKGIDATSLITTLGRPTTRKMRIVAHSQQVVRADSESTRQYPVGARTILADQIASVAGTYDAIVLSDYAKGLFSSAIVDAARGARVVTADPKPANMHLFTEITCVAPNVHEAEASCGFRINSQRSLDRAGIELLRSQRCEYVVITLGEHGMALFGSQGETSRVPSHARKVYDVSGAGDTAIAVLSLALAAEVPVAAALQLANFAAAVVVEKLGTASASAAEILSYVEAAQLG